MAIAAIYARKSKATDKGESIENQIKRGLALCEMRGWDHIVYQDYDFSGKSLDRPDFERMMLDVRNGKIDYIICYKLDRISRSVNDFSSLIEDLNTLGVGFICIKDNFDTTTPMGRAMMYITAVFAQLERETIAERVRDNMIDRAKMGKWNGGPVPYGFAAIRQTINNHGRNKKISKLTIHDDESKIIKDFYKWYLESDGSIRNSVFRANSPECNYKTRNGSLWNHNQMSRLLKNSLYCIADQDAYHYFKNHTKVQMMNTKDEFDGKHGLMFYNRRKPRNNTTTINPEEKWILVIGEHEGIIPGEIFSKAQMKLTSNKSHAPRSGQSNKSPLVGLVKCARCGSAMSIFSSRKSNSKEKGVFSYFRCLTREQRAKVLCDNYNIRVDKLENLIVKYIKDICHRKEFVEDLIAASNYDLEAKRIPLISKRNKLQSDIDKLESEMQNLVNALSKNILPEILIQKKYKELETQRKDLLKQINQVEDELNMNYTESYNIDEIMKYMETFEETYEYLSFDEKKQMLHSIIKGIEIDRDKVMLTLYFPCVDESNNHTFCLCTDMDSC